jgi:hypothetical protein
MERCARNYRPSFHENKPKTLVLYDWKWAFWACFHENWVYKFGHWCLAWAAQPASLRCLPFGSKLFQGIATMTYTRSHTRPSQKDLGCVVYPLNNKSLIRVRRCCCVLARCLGKETKMLFPCYGKYSAISPPPPHNPSGNVYDFIYL